MATRPSRMLVFLPFLLAVSGERGPLETPDKAHPEVGESSEEENCLLQACVDQRVLTCINEHWQWWPKCDPAQTKVVEPVIPGYVYGYYCTQEWVDALNTMLSTEAVNYCHDEEVIARLLAEVAWETGYFSTVFQPKDNGTGLIHMIPLNWPQNVADMDTIWPGNDYAAKEAAMEEEEFGEFFKTPQYAWLSVAAWFLKTNEVIPGCGKDLFTVPTLDDMTRCILGYVVDRSEAYDVAKKCIQRFK